MSCSSSSPTCTDSRSTERRTRIEEMLDLVGPRPMRRAAASAATRAACASASGLAAALLARPAVLFLDEPVSALDPAGRHDILEVIGRPARHDHRVHVHPHPQRRRAGLRPRRRSSTTDGCSRTLRSRSCSRGTPRPCTGWSRRRAQEGALEPLATRLRAASWVTPSMRTPRVSASTSPTRAVAGPVAVPGDRATRASRSLPSSGSDRRWRTSSCASSRRARAEGCGPGTGGAP